MQQPPRLPGTIPGVTFGGIALPSSDFEAVRDGRRAPMFYCDVDLSTARSFAAGSQLNIPISANFLYIDQRLNSGVAQIHFQDQNGNSTPITLFPGALWKVPFTQIGIENASQPGQTLRIIYGVDVDALPISAAGVTILNPVSIVDGGKARTLANKAFWGMGTVAAVAAQLSTLQIWNPVGSGYNVILKSTVASSPTAGPLLFAWGTTPGGFVAVVRNKFLGGAVGLTEIRTDNSVGGLAMTQNLAQVDLLASTPFPLKFDEPIILPPSAGISWQHTVVNATIRATFEFVIEVQ